MSESVPSVERGAAGRFLLVHDRVVNAGAGTGKTHALLTQYLHLVAGLSAHGRPIEPRALGVLTFTDKAAGELRERLQQRVGRIVQRLAEADPGAQPLDVAAELARERPRPLEDDLVATAAVLGVPVPGLRFWARVREQLGGAPIGTFHSFAATLLRRYAAAAAIDPDFELLDEDRARELRLLAAEAVVLAGLEGQLGAVPGEEVARLVSEFGFAGGPSPSGGLVEALCRLHAARAEEGRGAAGLAEPYRPESLERELVRLRDELRAAAATLAALDEQLGGKSAEGVAEVAELCGRAAELLTAGLGALAGLGELSTAIIERLKRLRAPSGKSADPGTSERLAEGKERLRAVLDELAALRASVAAAPLALALERLLDPLEEEYSLRKRAEGALDFTDLLRKARDLLRDDAAARAEVRARYTVLLVDELQDTSPIQAELVELIVGERSGERGPDRGGAGEARGLSAEPATPGRLFLVGDRKQSIYGFRGADVAAYTALCDRMQAAGADAETLDRSWRSRPSLLGFVNALFPRIMQRPRELAEASWYVRWEEARDPLRPVREEEAKAPTVELLRSEAPAAPAEDDAEAGPVPGDRAAPSPAVPVSSAIEDPLAREAELIARRILGLANVGVRFGDVAILLRRFTHIESYTTALKRAGVPHYVVRGRGFYSAPEVLDVAALFTLLDDPEDRPALLAVLRSPLCGLSDEALVRLNLAGRHTLLALLDGPPAGDAGTDEAAELRLAPDEAGRLLRLLAVLRPLLPAAERLGPAACLRAVLDHTDYLAVLAADPDGEQRIANVERLLGRAKDFEPTGGPARRGGLRGFVRALRLLTDPQLEAALGERPEEPAAQVLGEADNVVRLLTVHQAKGLEFPVVFVAGCAGTERSDQPLVAYDRAVGLGLVVSAEGERTPTLAWVQVQRLGRLRAEAESARLFYVAATRARDHLIFVGESRRRAPKGSWREHLDALLLEPGARALVHAWEPPPPPPPVPDEAAPALLHLTAAAQQAVARVYDLPERREAAAGLCLLAAQWADVLVCPRRLRLGELSVLGRRGALSDSAPARPRLTEEVLGLPAPLLRESGLPNRLLAHRDPARDGDDLPSVLSGLGIDPEQGGAALASLRRFLQSRELRRLLDAAAGPEGAVRWAVRVSAVAGPGPESPQSCGVLDALIVQDRHGEGPVATVLDVWDTTAPPAEGPLHAARRRLLGLAAAALCPEAQRIEVSLCFLREAEPVPPPIEVTEPELQELRAEMSRLAPAALHTLATVLEHPALAESECARCRCEHRAICFAPRQGHRND